MGCRSWGRIQVPIDALPLPQCSWGRGRKRVFKEKLQQDLPSLFALEESLYSQGIICLPLGPALSQHSLTLSSPEGRSMLQEEGYLLLFLCNFPFVQEGDEVEGCSWPLSSHLSWSRDTDPFSLPPFLPLPLHPLPPLSSQLFLLFLLLCSEHELPTSEAE